MKPMPRDEDILTKVSERRTKTQKELRPMEKMQLSELEDSDSKEEEEEEERTPPPPQPTIRVGAMDIPKGATEGLLQRGKPRVKEIAKRSREEEIELIREVIKGKK